MQIVKSREYRSAFQVDGWDIERLVDRLGGDERVTRTAIEFSDGSGAVLPHAGALSELPNPPSRSIASVCIESAPPSFLSADDADSRLAVIHLRDGGSAGISWYLSGSERAVHDLAGQLGDWVASVTPWYGRLAYTDRPGLVLRGLLALGSIAAISLATPFLLTGILPAAPLDPGGQLAFGARLLATASLALLALATFGVALRPRALFPTAQFRFGQGVTRFERTDRLRRLALRGSAALAVSTVVGSTLAGFLR